MIKKKIVIIFVEVIIILLFLLAVNFFYNLKMANISVSDYQAQTDKLSSLLTKALEAAKNAQDQNSILEAQNAQIAQESARLQGDNSRLKSQLADMELSLDKLQVNVSLVSPLKEKIKAIMASLDNVNLSSSRKDELDKLLRMIYNEVNSMELTLAKLAKDEPFYKAVAREQEGQIQVKVEEEQKILQKNYELSQQAAGTQAEIVELRRKMETLTAQKDEADKNASLREQELARYQDQIAQMQNERQADINEALQQKTQMEQMQSELKAMMTEKNTLEQQMNALQGENKKYNGIETEMARLQAEHDRVNEQYRSLKNKIGEYERSLVQRAGKIVTLQDSANNKASSLVKLKDGMKAKIKELAVLRDDIVRVKIENARLKNKLSQKEQAFNELTKGIDSIGTARKIFEGSAAPEDKKVDVNIDSVEDKGGN